MPRYTIGKLDETVHATVEADEFRIEGSFVVFVRDDRPIVAVPERQVRIVSELDENGKEFLEPTQYTSAYEDGGLVVI